jgi:hypothetical protein
LGSKLDLYLNIRTIKFTKLNQDYFFYVGSGTIMFLI